VQGMIAANDRMREGTLDSVLQAAATAFGFVYIHPLQDGNGRSTAASFITSWQNENSRHLEWFSRSHRSCSIG
jgi:fido (protein-threonine AMPylation protein)